MAAFDQRVVNRLKEVYEELTAVEKSIADFFLENREAGDFSSRTIAGRLYVSEASLSRFAKKCGYKGFREFIYNYEKNIHAQEMNIDELTGRVMVSYQELLEKSLQLVDAQQMHRIAQMLSECQKTYIYGMGSSGYAAQEYKLRFMRVGLNIEAVTDSHMMQITSALVTSGTLIVVFSISGQTRDIMSAVLLAKERGAKIILVTADPDTELGERCDEVLQIAGMKGIETGMGISAQFPILVMVDIFFSYYLNTDFYYKAAQHTDTVTAIYNHQTHHFPEELMIDEP